jgi:hypothetical protein
VGGASWKGDKYPRQPQEDPFYPYSSSTRHPADRVHPSSDEEDSRDDSYSSNGSGSETAAPSPRSGRGTGSRGTYKTRSTVPSIPIRALPPLDIYGGSFNLSGLSKSKSQQPWVAEPSGYKEKERARLPTQPTSNRQDLRSREVDTDFSTISYRGELGGGPPGLSTSKAMSQQPWVGQPAASSDRQSRSGHKENEGARASGQPSSNHPDPLGREADADFVVGSYLGKAGGGGISGYPTDSQSHSGPKEKESARLSMQPSSRRPDPQGRGADTDFMVRSGILGHPSDSQSRSGNKEKESPRSLGEPSSSRQEPRVREADVDYGTVGQGSVGGYRDEASGGASSQPIGKPAPALAPSSTQQPSERQPEYTSANRSLYAERDNRSSTATMAPTEHSSRPPPNPTTSIPHRQEDSPPYNTEGSGWGSSHPADPSRTTPYDAFPPTRPPQHAVQYSRHSQAQSSLGSERPEDLWDGGSSRPSGGRDSSSNPSAGATGSYPWGGQPTGTPPGEPTQLSHRVYFSSSSASNFLTTIHSGFDRRPAHESNPGLLTIFFLPRFTFSLTSF